MPECSVVEQPFGQLPRCLHVRTEEWALKQPFSFGTRTFVSTTVVVVEVEQGAARGRGECSPDGEPVEPVLLAIERARAAIETGADQRELASILPAGPARNALDCALWDLQAKLTGVPAWQRAGLRQPKNLVTAYTLGLDRPERVGAQAARESWRPLLKLKLADDHDVARVAAARQAAPDARLIVDANGTWTRDHFRKIVPVLEQLRVELIEQPFAPADDDWLLDLASPIPIGADESVNVAADLDRLVGRYKVINVKLDKCGGFSAALELSDAARARGFAVMVGCMMGTSLAMAPAHLIAQRAVYADIDAPLYLVQDREPALCYDRALVRPPDRALWG